MTRKPKRSDITDEEILDACRRFHAEGCRGLTVDMALAHKYPTKVILAKMQQMADRGLINYGTSLRTAWVVEHPESHQ